MAPTFSRTPVIPEAPAPQIDTPLPGSLLPSEVWANLRVALRLSERELKIVQCVMALQEQDAIAASVGISEELVYRGLQRIYIKLKIGSRIELRMRVRSAIAAALRNPPDLALSANNQT